MKSKAAAEVRLKSAAVCCCRAWASTAPVPVAGCQQNATSSTKWIEAVRRKGPKG